jgi:hypothetical protein
MLWEKWINMQEIGFPYRIDKRDSATALLIDAARVGVLAEQATESNSDNSS